MEEANREPQSPWPNRLLRFLLVGLLSLLLLYVKTMGALLKLGMFAVRKAFADPKKEA